MLISLGGKIKKGKEKFYDSREREREKLIKRKEEKRKERCKKTRVKKMKKR